MFYNSSFGLQDSNQINKFILSSATGDVNGDGLRDKVFLTGNKTSDNPFIQDITLLVQDGRTGLQYIASLNSNEGYNPTLFLGDFNRDGVKEILISISSGGSGGTMYYYIFSALNNNLNLIFDYEEFNNLYQYEVNYKDYYKVEVLNLKEKTSFIIDISLKSKDYLYDIYSINGRLKSPIKGFVNPLSGLYPIDFDTDGVYELLAYQKVAGKYNADSLGYIQTTIKWNKNQFNVSDQYLAVLNQKN